ncbi:MAG: membrane dipeptidase [Anaerolineales bacterium]|nr:membrane dipeptidase [Anaerolineales bacterium]
MIVDAHEDLAWNMLTFQRDYTQSVKYTRAREAGSEVVERNGETLLGWPDWRRGGVGLVFGVLFASPEHRTSGEWDWVAYSEAGEAHRLYWRQLDLYEQLVDEHPQVFRLISSGSDLDEHLQQWESDDTSDRRLGLVLLMEGAEGIREPQELEAWHERGVRIVGPAWDATRYAGSCYTPGRFTALGYELLEVMGELNVILDLSHLSEEAALEGLDRYPGPVIASHSNVRRLLPSARYPERHLSVTTIERLIERDGVVGIVLANKFLQDGWRPGDARARVTLDDVVAHVDSVCQIAGDARHVGIGSDFDGGFGRSQVPAELNSVADLGKIGAALARRGYEEDDILGVLGKNWIRIVHGTLPSA